MAKYKSKYPLSIQLEALRELCYDYDLFETDQLDLPKDLSEACIQRWERGYAEKGDEWFQYAIPELLKNEMEEECDRLNYRVLRLFKDEFFGLMDKLLEEGDGEDCELLT